MTPRLRALRDDLAPESTVSRALVRGAAAWLAIGVIHVAALAMSGWQWTGAVSFRKPIVFSISVGLMLATIGWILDRLPARHRLPRLIGWTLLVSSTIEVALITVQAWRGKASHFNVLEGGDAIIFAAMGVAVGFMSIALVATLIWAVVEPPGDPLIRTATVAGLAMITTGLGIGQWIIELGNQFVADHGYVPDTVVSGAAGVAKFPHAIAFHGIQVFIVVALMLRASELSERQRHRSMWLVVISYGVGLALATAQAIVGESPSQFTALAVGQVTTTATLVAALVWVGRRWLSSGARVDESQVRVTQPI